MIPLAVAIVVRFVGSWVSHGEPVVDVASFYQWAQHLDNGIDPYSAGKYRANYPPLWLYICWACLKLAHNTGLSFDLWVKLVVSLVDALTVIPIGLLALAHGASEVESRRAALFYSLNGAAVLVGAFHGQNDPLVIGLVMWSVWLVIAQPFPRSPELGWLVLGLSLAIKPVGVLFAPVMVMAIPGWRRRVLGVMWIIVPSIAFWLPYFGRNPRQVFQALESYRGVPDFGFIGIYNSWNNLGHGSEGVPFDYDLGMAYRPLCVALLALVWWRFRRAQLLKQVVAILLTLYLTYGKLAGHYLIWVLPFATALRSAQLLRATVLTALALFAFYQLHHPSILTGRHGERLVLGITVPQWSGLFLLFQVMLYLHWFRWLRELFRDFGRATDD